MRVSIIGVLHESNTFVRDLTHRADFEDDVLVTGAEVARHFRDAPHEIGGFLAGLQHEQVECDPILAARATPAGMIADETLHWLRDTVIDHLEQTRPDGVLVASHGSAVSPAHPDADGFLLSSIRDLAGPEIPIIGTLDSHANLSRRMAAATDALIGYQTNPHVDQRDRGMEAAQLMARTLRREVTPTQAAAFPRIAISIDKQYTGEPPCSGLAAMAHEVRSEPDVLSSSVLLGFPYSDVPEMGSSVIVVTDNQPRLAQQLADGIAQHLESSGPQFVGEFVTIEDALDQALKLEGPVCLLDLGDNIGGGAPGSGTALARAIDARRVDRAFVALVDPNSVSRAGDVGVGARESQPWSMGGTAGEPPLLCNVTVESLHNGQFEEPDITHGGITRFDQGPTAIVRTDHGMTVMLASRRVPPFSLRQLTALGVDPAEFRLIVVKGVHAPRVAYSSVCRHFIRVDTPGITRADITQLKYRNRRRPMLPFEALS